MAWSDADIRVIVAVLVALIVVFVVIGLLRYRSSEPERPPNENYPSAAAADNPPPRLTHEDEAALTMGTSAAMRRHLQDKESSNKEPSNRQPRQRRRRRDAALNMDLFGADAQMIAATNPLKISVALVRPPPLTDEDAEEDEVFRANHRLWFHVYRAEVHTHKLADGDDARPLWASSRGIELPEQGQTCDILCATSINPFDVANANHTPVVAFMVQMLSAPIDSDTATVVSRRVVCVDTSAGMASADDASSSASSWPQVLLPTQGLVWTVSRPHEEVHENNQTWRWEGWPSVPIHCPRSCHGKFRVECCLVPADNFDQPFAVGRTVLTSKTDGEADDGGDDTDGDDITTECALEIADPNTWDQLIDSTPNANDKIRAILQVSILKADQRRTVNLPLMLHFQ